MLIFCAIYFTVMCTCCDGARFRVNQGTEDLQNEFPFVVALMKAMVRFCTASLISETYVITAGHCLVVSIDKYVVRYSDFTHRPNETKANVRPIAEYLHPGYRTAKGVFNNDIALIFTKKVPIPFAKLSSVDFKGLLGLPAKYAGFGRINKKTPNLKKMTDEGQKRNLQTGEGVVTTCPQLIRYAMYPAICIAPKCSAKEQMVMHGDSGGPLIINGKIVGVATGYSKESGSMSLFTPVSPNLEWIHGVMNANERK